MVLGIVFAKIIILRLIILLIYDTALDELNSECVDNLIDCSNPLTLG